MVVHTSSTKVSKQIALLKVRDVSKQIAPPSPSSNPRIAYVKMATMLQTYSKDEMPSFTLFLLAKSLNLLGDICGVWR